MPIFIAHQSICSRMPALPFGVQTVALMLALGLIGVPAMVRATEDNHTDKPSTCITTASVMLEACRADGEAEFKVTIAHCLNDPDRGEMKTCQDEARVTLEEHTEGCSDQHAARIEVCEVLGEDRYHPDPLLAPTITFIDPDAIDKNNANPYVSLVAGHTSVLRGGDAFKEIVVVHVTDETREIQGVNCRVVVDIALETEQEDGDIKYIPLEVTDDWFAQDVNRNVYYCGELSRNFEDGLLDNLDGSFEAGKKFAKAGVLIRAFPAVGDAHRQEFALGEAEDVIEYLDLHAIPTDEEGGENVNFPCAPSGCLKTHDFAALAPDATEFKYYLPGTGFVLAVALENGKLTGEREELVCVGDSLEILKHERCGIEAPAELLKELCKLSPQAFCAGD
jgi:hypothetical protein